VDHQGNLQADFALIVVAHTILLVYALGSIPPNFRKPNTSASEGCEFNIELALQTKHHQETNIVLLMRSILN